MTPPSLASLRLPPWLEAELRWYVSGAGRVEAVISSSFQPLVNMAMAGFGSARATSDPAIDAANKLVGASRKAWRIERWLSAIDPAHREALLAHYGEAPARLDAFGTWAGVAHLCPSYRKARGKGGRDLESLSTRLACSEATLPERALVAAVKVEAFALVARASFSLALVVEDEQRSSKLPTRKAR